MSHVFPAATDFRLNEGVNPKGASFISWDFGGQELSQEEARSYVKTLSRYKYIWYDTFVTAVEQPSRCCVVQ